MAKDNPDLYSELYEPKIVEALTAELSEKLNFSIDGSKSNISAVTSAEETPEEAEKKRQSRGGKGLIRDESVKLDKEAQKRAVSNLIL